MAGRYKPEPKEPGVNRKNLENALASWNLPLVDVKDPFAIEKRISEYLEHCMEKDVAPSVAGCANWLRVGISTLTAWRDGRTGSPEHQRIANAFYLTLQEIWAQDMHERNIDPVSGIFTAKVFFGYQETQEIVVNHRTSLEVSTADLIAQSKMLPGAETLRLPSSTPIIDAETREIPQKEVIEYCGEKLEIDRPKILDDLKYVDDEKYENAVKKKQTPNAERH